MSSTESYNSLSTDLDTKSSREFVDIFLEVDTAVHKAIKNAAEDIANIIDLIAARMQSSIGSKLFYLGAGTSGRLGVLDAAECPPTFSVDPQMIQAIIAGGSEAITSAAEGAEDNAEAGFKDVQDRLSSGDILVAISASGNAAYVIAAMQAARKIGALVIAITNNSHATMLGFADHQIVLETGPEIISGSTRLKAGTSQKIVLNMLSTGLMLKLGKIYSNLMVDVKATNKKLVLRAIRLTMEIAACTEQEAKEALESCNYKVKTAVVSIIKKIDCQKANELLMQNQGFLRKCIS
ncbi:MAG: N-acetylmuramic acid 6-phosphate etherase [Candidatus Caenarcaniphilales bacterium]|jgi:N-acetylmuramic acid 6-phosphate etherase|nr:N-acetylmuramic acid 6-phosphate etherase [Candidatus Caenarcaniphilales bacterium]